ncbi:MAG: protein-disulfide reductase DsbD domain-containing protein [Fimbriimonadales bacterium]
MPSLGATLGLLALTAPPLPRVSVSWASPSVAPGGTARATLSVELADGFHAYANPPSRPELIPLSVELIQPPKGVKATFTYPVGQLRAAGGDSQPVSVYESTVRVSVAVTAPAARGRYPLRFRVSMQQCDEVQCFLPQQVEVRTELVVAQPPTPRRGVKR